MTDVRLLKASANALPLDDESVQTVVTSPPYWGLRQYAGEQSVEWADGTTHPLGLEPTPDLYVEHMVEVFREVKRVLRPDGTLWMNLGDSYAANRSYQVHNTKGASEHTYTEGASVPPGLKPKDLVGIPWMVAFALRADGWYLRSDIIWHKPNPMPESVTDRPTKAHEYLFLLTKSERYFYDADAIREPLSEWSKKALVSDWTRRTRNPSLDRNDGGEGGNDGVGASYASKVNPAGRNKRTVWTVATRPYSGAHFATYPEDLIEPCILAGSSPKACGVCGAPWARVTEVERVKHPHTPGKNGRAVVPGSETSATSTFRTGLVPRYTTTGWRPMCLCIDPDKRDLAAAYYADTTLITEQEAARRAAEVAPPTVPCTVLDPFNGSGTTGLVAVRHNRNYVGVDISDEYLDLARERIDGIQRGFPWEAA